MTKAQFQIALLQFLNIPYRWGGDSPMKGLDCNGFVQIAFDMLGLDPQGDQTAQGYFDYFKTRCNEGPRDTASLAFYGTGRITHIGLFFDEHRIIEAAGGDQTTTSLARAIEQAAFVKMRMFNRRADLIKIINPQGLPW